jgi:predicted transcriptional regulator
VDEAVFEDVDFLVERSGYSRLEWPMASTTVRVSDETHELLRKLAAATGEPMQRVLERAVENYRREQFYAEFNAAFERLRADPVAWEEELAERALLENTLADGLDDL